mgnify:CR=1 FL=1
MPDILKDYFEALERLKKGKPTNVPKGTRITNDSVSLEAGRKKGTIKKSRPIFSDLIEAIDAAAKAEAKQVKNSKANPAKARAGVPVIRKIRNQPKAVMASRAARTTNPTGARTATATLVAAAAARTCSGIWTNSISTAR